MSDDPIAERLTQLETVVRRAAETMGRLREENDRLRRDKARLMVRIAARIAAELGNRSPVEEAKLEAARATLLETLARARDVMVER